MSNLRAMGCESESRSVMSNSLQPCGLCSPWNSPGQDTGVGSHFPSPGDLPNPGIEPRSPALQVDSLPAEPQTSHKLLCCESHWVVSTLCDPMDYSPPGSSVHGILQARILEWVAIPFSRGSSRPRNRTEDSCTAGGFFTNWAIREVLPTSKFLFCLNYVNMGLCFPPRTLSVIPIKIAPFFLRWIQFSQSVAQNTSPEVCFAQKGIQN